MLSKIKTTNLPLLFNFTVLFEVFLLEHPVKITREKSRKKLKFKNFFIA